MNSNQQQIAAPEWMRLPTRGRDPLFQQTRPTYYEWIKRGHVRSSCIRRPGCETGIRLVEVASVWRFIEQNAV